MAKKHVFNFLDSIFFTIFKGDQVLKYWREYLLPKGKVVPWNVCDFGWDELRQTKLGEREVCQDCLMAEIEEEWEDDAEMFLVE